MKNILERESCDNCTSSDKLLPARATFFSNIFVGTSVLFVLEHERSYTSALLEGNRSMLSVEILEAYNDL